MRWEAPAPTDTFIPPGASAGHARELAAGDADEDPAAQPVEIGRGGLAPHHLCHVGSKECR
jgi:hypothetical protein